MIYSYDDLIGITSTAIPSDKWGDNTKKVVSIINAVKNTNCSPCMLNKKVAELNALMAPYGDRVGRGTYIKPYISTQDGRIECPDCVEKHINQAFVLQSEFYQGYTEYIGLMSSHLKEALEECPKNNEILRKLLENCIKSVEIDKKPEIPLILLDFAQEEPKTTIHRGKYPVIPEISDILHDLSATDARQRSSVRRLILKVPKISTYTDPITLSEFKGCIACVSDLLAVKSPRLANIMRDIRLWVGPGPGSPSDARKVNEMIDTLKKCALMDEYGIIPENTP